MKRGSERRKFTTEFEVEPVWLLDEPGRGVPRWAEVESRNCFMAPRNLGLRSVLRHGWESRRRPYAAS